MAFIPKDVPLPRGVYGDITSTLYWCEEKFRWSKYVAEPYNTFSNIFFVLLSLYGASQARKEKLLKRFVLTHLGITLVGVGSFLFHCTLKYEAQLLDELPMIYVSMLLTYAVIETAPRGVRPRFEVLLPVALAGITVFITVAYIINNNPIFHQVAYGLIQLGSTLRVVYLLHSSRSPLAKGGKSSAGDARRTQARKLYTLGAVTFLGGFLVWNIDNAYCAQLRQWRQQLRAHGLGWATGALEFHALWHLATGLGAYLLVVSSSLLIMSIKEKPEHFELRSADLPLGLGRLVPSVRRVKQWQGEQNKVK